MYVCVCVCELSFHLFWTSGLGTYQPESHRRKVTQDFSSTFLLRCLPSFFSREGFSRSFPSSTVEVEFLCTNELIVLHLLDILFYFYEEKSQFVLLDRPNVRRFRGYQPYHRGDRCHGHRLLYIAEYGSVL